MNIAAVILAAGLGTRMKSSVPKVLHTLFGKTLLQYALDAVSSLSPDRIVIVHGPHTDGLKESAKPPHKIKFSLQREQKGTAHALSSALKNLRGFRGSVLVLCADTPLLTPETLKDFARLHNKRREGVSVLSFRASDPAGYGRILRDSKGKALRIVEHKDASSQEKTINEVNSGVYLISAPALPLLKKIKLNPKKGEYYLTDIFGLAASQGMRTGVHCLGTEDEFMGINTRADISAAYGALMRRHVRALMERGVTFIDPDASYIAPTVVIGPDTVIYPNVFIHGETSIGKNCAIYPNSRIIESVIEDNVSVKDGCLIEESHLCPGSSAGPFAHLRPGSVLGKGAKAGNFVEIKKSVIGEGSKAMHLSYIGDSTVGRGVNIGAGTITCNYDGINKFRTVIEDGVFIGSDTQLVAPVRVGKGAYVGAGSTITRDVPAGSLAISRPRQKAIEGWVESRKSRPKKGGK